jgi:pyroglutamyl-peptidase
MSALPGGRLALLVLCLLAGACGPSRAQQPSPAAPADDAARTAEVKKFVEHYFSTWSNVEMDAYADLFLNEAVIQFIDERGQLHSQAKRPFILEQRRVQARNPGKETPESIEIRFEPNLARAVVHWKLVMGNRVEYGYDHFTLARQEGKWKIVNLVFYKVDAK